MYHEVRNVKKAWKSHWESGKMNGIETFKKSEYDMDESERLLRRWRRRKPQPNRATPTPAVRPASGPGAPASRPDMLTGFAERIW